ncbi:hypothetical protein GGR53DRAFT_526743 [Hypoxylon sp. FL1150]|nr:hypothetical protein GGR53DRAFT_526743 [Hypoxylon sp. FL1150]
MASDEEINILEDNIDALRELRLKYRRVRTLLAISNYEKERLKDQAGVLNSEGWVSKRKRLRDESKYRQWKRRDERRELLGINVERDILGIPRSPPPKPYNRTATDKKIKSYKKAIRRTQDQLLLAAAGAHQYREVTFATRQGRAIDGMDPDIPRKHRAFEARRDASLSSNEAAARTIKNWLNRERVRRQGGNPDGDDDRISLESDGGGGGSGGAMAMMARAGVVAMEGHSHYRGGPSAGDPNIPILPDPRVYNPRQWVQLLGSYFDKGVSNGNPFEQPPDSNIPTGWLTWEEQEKQYPTLDKILHVPEVQPEQLWDLPSRVAEQLEIEDRSKRSRLELGGLTKLSIERGYMAEMAEMVTFYRPYSQIPLALPTRASEEEMRRGPLPEPPRLPLQGPTGPVIDLKPRPPTARRVGKSWKKALEGFDADTASMELPKSKADYMPSHPEKSEVTFPSGKKISDLFKQTELDNTGHIRVSDELRAYGLKQVEQKRKHFRPYEYETIDLRPPPGTSFPHVTPKVLTEEERDALNKASALKANMLIGADLQAAGVPANTLPAAFISGEQPPAPSNTEKIAKTDWSSIKRHNGSSSSSFHHYEKITDSSSSVFTAWSKAPSSETFAKAKKEPASSGPRAFFGVKNPFIQSDWAPEPSASYIPDLPPSSETFKHAKSAAGEKKVHFA